jgi:hypothetical protein
MLNSIRQTIVASTGFVTNISASRACFRLPLQLGMALQLGR